MVFFIQHRKKAIKCIALVGLTKLNLFIIQAEIFPETGGRVFYNEAVMSMQGIPTVS